MSNTKKEIRIPRLWVYASAFVAGLVVTTVMGLCLGAEYAIDFVTNAICFGCIFILSANVFDRIDRQKFRLTWKYWTLVGLIVVTDFLFAFTAKAETKDTCIIRACIFFVGLILTSFYAYFIYAPSQYELFAEVKEASKKELVEYLDGHAGEETTVMAEGILELFLAKKVKKEAEKEGEEVSE